MAAGRFVLPYQTVIDPTGVPIPGAKLFFYISGTDTPQNTYADEDLTTPNSNPVPADSSGMFPNIFLLPDPYKVVLTDDLGAEIWTADPVENFGQTSITARRAVSGNTTVLPTDSVIEVDATSGPVTVTYPLGLGGPQQTQVVEIIKVDDTSNAVNIIDDSAATVRFSLTSPANGDWMEAAQVYSNGSALRIAAWVSPFTAYMLNLDNIAALKAAGIPNGAASYNVRGYYAPDDGGGGIFDWDATNATADNGGTIINPTGNLGNGRWVRQVNGPISVNMFGAIADGTTDNSAAFKAALAVDPDGIVYVDGSLNDIYGLGSSIPMGDGTHGIGLVGQGGLPTLTALAAFDASTDLLTMGTNTLLPFRPILADISLDANNFARRCLTMFSAQSPTLRRLQFSNSLLENVAFTVLGTSWIERLLIEQCDWQSAGSDQILWSLAGAGGSFINEVVITDCRLSGASKLQNGGHQMRFTSTATTGASTFTNFLLLKPHFDVQFVTGQAGTPAVDAIDCNSGPLTNVTLINPQFENTGNGTLGSGYVINPSGSGIINGVNGISVSNNSGYATLGLSPNATDSKWDSYSFIFESFRGPVSGNGLRGTTASLATGTSANIFATPASTTATYLISATGGDGSPSYAASAILSTDGLGTWQVDYISNGTHVQFIGSGTALAIRNVDLGANTIIWSAIRTN